MKGSRAIIDFSDELYDFGNVQEIDETGVYLVQVSQYYAKRTDYSLTSVETTLRIDRF